MSQLVALEIYLGIPRGYWVEQRSRQKQDWAQLAQRVQASACSGGDWDLLDSFGQCHQILCSVKEPSWTGPGYVHFQQEDASLRARLLSQPWTD